MGNIFPRYVFSTKTLAPLFSCTLMGFDVQHVDSVDLSGDYYIMLAVLGRLEYRLRYIQAPHIENGLENTEI
jgi:hypothetical protein